MDAGKRKRLDPQRRLHLILLLVLLLLPLLPYVQETACWLVPDKIYGEPMYPGDEVSYDPMPMILWLMWAGNLAVQAVLLLSRRTQIVSIFLRLGTVALSLCCIPLLYASTLMGGLVGYSYRYTPSGILTIVLAAVSLLWPVLWALGSRLRKRGGTTPPAVPEYEQNE